MPISYSQSSSSKESFDVDFPIENTDGDYGVPRRCFCGWYVKLEVSNTEENRGRKYYKCPNSEGEGHHINKWWDEAVDEELHKVNLTFEDHKERILNAYRYGGGNIPALESIRESMRQMRVDIDELKERLTQKDVEIARLRALLAKW